MGSETENRFKSARLNQATDKNGSYQSIQTVAKATGVTHAIIDDLEAGKDRNVGYQSIVKLARHYGVSMDYLCGLTDVATADFDKRKTCEALGLSDKALEVLDVSNAGLQIQTVVNLLLESDCFTTMIKWIAYALFTKAGILSEMGLDMKNIDIPLELPPAEQEKIDLAVFRAIRSLENFIDSNLDSGSATMEKARISMTPEAVLEYLRKKSETGNAGNFEIIAEILRELTSKKGG